MGRLRKWREVRTDRTCNNHQSPHFIVLYYVVIG